MSSDPLEIKSTVTVPEDALWDLVDKWRDAARNITDANSPYLSKNPLTACAQGMNSAADDLSDLILEIEDGPLAR